jgi:peptidoglycan/xylan/chitin deacetylase (PgdA/CDA1 family)
MTQGFARHPGTFSNACVVLQYCRVALLTHDPHQLAVQPCVFERQMEYLAESCNVLSFDAMANCLTRGRPFPPRSVVVTFDGGYAELLYTVQEVPERLNLCATAFVPSSMLVDGRPIWYDELEDLLIANDASAECEITIDNRPIRVSTRNQYERLASYDQLVSSLSHRPSRQQHQILDELRQCIEYEGSEADSHRRLRIHELKRLDERGCISIGGSTHHHVSPEGLTRGQQLAQVSENRDVLEEILGHEIEHFSYPFWSVLSPPTAAGEPLESFGYRTICCNNPGVVTIWTESGRYELPRVLASDRSLFRFHQRLAMSPV